MKAGASDEDLPTTTVEFSYRWPNAARMTWAATKLKAAFRAHIVRRRMAEVQLQDSSKEHASQCGLSLGL